MERLDYNLKDLEGNVVSLRNLLQKRKLNLLLFYNNDCLGCTGRALPLAYDFQENYDKIQLIVIHSSFGGRNYSPEELNAVFTTGEAPFPIYIENGHDLYDAFDCDGTPHWVVMNDEYEVLHSIFGSQDGAQLKLEYALAEYLGK